MFSLRCWLSLVLALVCFCSSVPAQSPVVASAEAPTAVPTELYDYVGLEDDSFEWKLTQTEPLPGGAGKLHLVEFTSQTWQGIPWKHVLAIFEPAEIKHPEHALLYITGGSHDSKLRDRDMKAGAKMAVQGGFCVGYLLQVPNQPLLGDRVEDDLITETFLRYLKTKDAKWPLLFPMVKSAVRAMDVITEVSDQKWNGKVNKFVVTGASKRGWTTWLTGAADPRVAGIAPIVIDMLNMQPQMKHQIDIWGDYSIQIHDYTSKGLVEVMQEHPEIPLYRWVDPYTYREKLTMPKLLINGTNDPYWVVDALNIYWDDLKGEKHILYVPNAGHGLQGGAHLAVETIIAFVGHVAEGKPLPNLEWEFDQSGDVVEITITSDVRPVKVNLWTAQSGSNDFRESQWSATEVSGSEGTFRTKYQVPANQATVLYAEAVYENGDHQYGLCTQVHRAAKK